MAAPSKPAQQPKPTAHHAFQNSGNNASLLLEKTHPGVRRSTPDSEALASSDDELEQHHLNQIQNAPPQKTARRTSWLNEVPSSLPRKASLTASNSFPSTSSNPTTPAVDQTSWGTNPSPGLSNSMTWGPSGTGSFPWGTAIWNTESRKEPPSRLTEVLQSPTSTNPPNTNGGVGEDIISPTARNVSNDPSIPFAIPLHPTPKTYRSQSYSVGQLDPEAANPANANKSALPYAGTGRQQTRNGSQYSSLQHRPSRPSLLGELGHDPATLGRVREDDDDEGNAGAPESGYNRSASQTRTYEQLAMENALLRQAASGQLENSRFRDRAASTTSANNGYVGSGALTNQYRIRGSVPEESDLAVEDQDELGDIPDYNNIRSNRRRFSEHSANLEKQIPSLASLENRNLENVKRAHWQTSLDFGGVPELSQSRRHSFADIPTRQGSIGSSADPQAAVPGLGTRPGLTDRDDGYGNYGEGTLATSPGDSRNREYSYFRTNYHLAEHAIELEHLRARQFAASYFSGQTHALRGNDNLPPSGLSTSLHQAYVMPNAYGRQHANMSQPHQNQLLFIVTFKCCRADVFYVQEDTGLQVKPGELVIVEADRGTDLGTVAHANVTWAKARELKEYYAEEHYKWLMLFSRQSQTGAPNAVNPNGNTSALNGAPGSAVGGMGPPGQHGMQEPQSGDIKPKLIKRLAQNHEIQTLRDKEGNEAKAKRVCQQKVVEHRLNMEILDAEFQMDWKKLTFYYFADAYINFNSLVTDLFKIYKTRIWMSAINPASFVTPTAGLQPPGVNPAGIGYGQEADRRRQGYGMTGPSPGKFAESADVGREIGQTGGLQNSYADPYQAFGQAGRQPGLGLTGFAPSLQPQADPFSSYPSGGNYGGMESGIGDYGAQNAAGSGALRNAHPAHPTHGDWVQNFHGLSLNS
ncbi:hypothetical protein FQN54_005607 [Arachnomyces sp. PD_36]|nr:hypothetical protein FQN54_005607 [Arachnomyces sp. PD_36]